MLQVRNDGRPDREAEGTRTQEGDLGAPGCQSFYTHHVQRLSRADALGNVKGIHDSLRGLRQQVAAAARPTVSAA